MRSQCRLNLHLSLEKLNMNMRKYIQKHCKFYSYFWKIIFLAFRLWDVQDKPIKQNNEQVPAPYLIRGQWLIIKMTQCQHTQFYWLVPSFRQRLLEMLSCITKFSVLKFCNQLISDSELPKNPMRHK